MRREFFAGISRAMVKRYAIWAAKIVKVEGGYMAFESTQDYETWRKQR